MSGKLAKLNRIYDEIKNTITEKELNLIDTVLKYDETGRIDKVFLETLTDQIQSCNDLISKCDISIGQLDSETKPSGQLVKTRKRWKKKKEAFEELKEYVLNIKENKFDILKNYQYINDNNK